MAKIRVLIADDHAVFREGIRMLINAQQDIEVVGEAGDAREALHQASEICPDVLIMDLSMPGQSSIPVIERLRQVSTKTRVLVLTMHDDVSFLRAVMAAGGSGYILKTAPSAGLLSAIRAIYQGGTYVDAVLHESLVHHITGMRAAGNSSATEIPSSPLSSRELEVLQRLAEGYTNQQIAEQLFLSIKTIEAHRARIYKKLGMNNRADLVRYAMEIGLHGTKKNPGPNFTNS